MGVHPVEKRSYGSDRRRPLTYLNQLLFPNLSTPITSILHAFQYCTAVNMYNYVCHFLSARLSLNVRIPTREKLES